MNYPKVKFQIGDWVTTVTPYHSRPESLKPSATARKDVEFHCHRIPLQVLERIIQDCPGGRQVHYKCRPHFMEVRADSFRTHPYYQSWGGGDIKSWNEIELEAYSEKMEKDAQRIPEVEPEPTKKGESDGS